jgi:hypothetical protein
MLIRSVTTIAPLTQLVRALSATLKLTFDLAGQDVSIDGLPVIRQESGRLRQVVNAICSLLWRAGAEDITKCRLTPMMSGTGFHKLCHGLQDFLRKLLV